MSVRCFIAINLSEDVRSSIHNLIAELRKSNSDVAWVRPENIHLTLKFLGSTDESLIPKIKEQLTKKLSHYSPFYIKIVGVGCFPSERRPRVLWIGIENSDILRSIRQDIDNEVSGFGFPLEERPFSPHLTIGRVRSQKGIAEMLSRLEEFRRVDFGLVEVKCIDIIRSELKPAGAQYTGIAEIPIGTGRNNVKGIEQRNE